MPAIMDDPDSPTIFRVSGEPPYPDPNSPSLPATILPRQVTLRDRQTVATVVPFASRHQVPQSLLNYLADQFAKEIEGGDTYPMIEPMSRERFASYWFQNFGAIMLLGSIDSPDDVVEGKDWSKECLGSFYIKPNYPGRSSHVCNAGFLVTDASRNRGVGRLMGESYLDWAPKLGYTYSVFNLVYETNVASCKIWDALGFKRIGRVKGCGNLKSYPGRLIDAIIYGRDLVLGESDELVSEERFDKIKFYLKYGKYPKGADRAEKSRLRSATTHYKLIDGDKLMLKDKEVISDPQQQYEIARRVHMQQHGGINKTTATITEKYHWSRIKETVSDVIRNCGECKELGKTPLPGNNNNGNSVNQKRSNLNAVPTVPSPTPPASSGIMAAPRRVPLPDPQLPPFAVAANQYAHPSELSVMSPAQTLHTPTESPIPPHANLPGHNPMLQDQSHRLQPTSHPSHHAADPGLPLSDHSVYQPIDPQIISQPSTYAHHHPVHHHDSYAGYHSHHHNDADADTFQALLNATDDVDHVSTHQHLPHHHDPHHRTAEEEEADREAVDRDLDMLIEPQDDDDDDPPGMDIDIGAGVNHDDLSKMSVTHLLSAPETDGSIASKDPDSPKTKEMFDVDYSAPG